MLVMIMLTAAVSTTNTVPVVFPCKKGSVHVYKGHGKWQTGSGMDSVYSQKVTLRSTVLRCINRPGERIAIVNGLPFDDAWGDMGRSKYAIIQTHNGLYIRKIFIDSTAGLTEIKPRPEDKYLRFPVKKNECAQQANKRSDGMYCWFVNSVEKKTGKTLWGISYMTLPDDSFVEIEPGMGIVSYEYEHHGTIAEVNMHLVDNKKQ